jgi:DNA-binding response OmpR family regulator
VVRILLIEDEEPLAAVVKRGLEKAHYAVDWYEDGRAGYEAACDGGYDLIVLDLMLPGMDGWSICRRLRDRRDPAPILMLTALGEVDERVRGLELGADDYLPKPFAFPELRARVAALLRRGNAQKRRVLHVDDLTIDTEARQVSRAGRSVSLTPREFDLLAALAGREGQILSKEVIQGHVWADSDGMPNTVEVHMAALRRKVDSGRPYRLIHTIHRQGYMLRRPEEGDVPVEQESEP